MKDIHFLDLVKIKPNSSLFPGEEGRVAYIGKDGVSVYLTTNSFDEPVPLNWNEFYKVSE